MTAISLRMPGVKVNFGLRVSELVCQNKKLVIIWRGLVSCMIGIISSIPGYADTVTTLPSEIAPPATVETKFERCNNT